MLIVCRDHKGSGLALMLELLTGALVGGAMEDKKAAKNWANLVLAIDPARFDSSEGFTRRVRQMLDRVKWARREEGVSEILLPGERGYREAGNCMFLLCDFSLLPIQRIQSNQLRGCSCMVEKAWKANLGSHRLPQ